MAEMSRYPEIDLVRGIAILMMILFHTVFDLFFFRILPVEVYSGFWRYFALATASLFLLIVGISLTISRARAASVKPGIQLALKFVYREPASSFSGCWSRYAPGYFSGRASLFLVSCTLSAYP